MLTPHEKALIVDLIQIAWGTGNVKSPQVAQAVENLRAKMVKKEENDNAGDSKDGSPKQD